MNPALSLALSRALPTEEQTLLLRACLYRGPAGAEAWADFRRRGPEPLRLLREGPPDVRRIAPLLFAAIRESGAAVEPGLLTVLRTAHLREELRSAEYRRICGLVLSGLGATGIPFIVFRGGALSETVYPHPALRHSHDLNLLVPPAHQERAAERLRGAGCTSRPGPPDTDALVLDHDSGLPVLLHSHFFRISFYQREWDALWSGNREGRVAGRSVRVLSPGDALLHLCCQAFQSVRLEPFVWAADAYLLMRRHPDLDWTALLQSAGRSRTELPLRMALDYLARDLHAPVPEAARARLAAATEVVEPVERDVALLAARGRRGMRLRSLVRGRAGWGAQLASLRWLLLPSRGYLEWAYGTPRAVNLPLVYLRRIGRYLARRAAWQLRRAPAASRARAVRPGGDEPRLPAGLV